MALAAAAGLGTKVRHALAFAILSATALLALLNPWLAVFAVIGFALGWVLRSPRRFLGGLATVGSGLEEHVGSPWRIASALAALATVAVTVWGLTAGVGLHPDLRIREVVPVSYLAHAKLETNREAFALRERVVVPRESLEQLRDEATPEPPAAFLARHLVRTGWSDPRLVGEVLEVSRRRWSESTSFGRLTRRATLALALPHDEFPGRPDRRGTPVDVDVVATEATVDVVAPKHWVLATAPPSEAQTLPDDMEQRRLRINDADEGEEIQLELAGPLFRNDLGALLLGLSGAGAVKWGVLLVFGVFHDELRKLVGSIFGTFRPRRPAAAPPPPTPPDS